MNRREIGYWIATGLFCLIFIGGGASHLLRADTMVEGVASLGFPIYLTTILGIAKLSGVAALLAPGFPLLKEWAYAGFTFNLLGASASHAFVGHPVSEIVTPLIILAIGAASYALRPAARRV